MLWRSILAAVAEEGVVVVARKAEADTVAGRDGTVVVLAVVTIEDHGSSGIFGQAADRRIDGGWDAAVESAVEGSGAVVANRDVLSLGPSSWSHTVELVVAGDMTLKSRRIWKGM